MSNAIRDAIPHGKANSLSPESCVLSPGSDSLIHASRPTGDEPSLWTTDRIVPGAWMSLRRFGGGC